MDTNLFTYKCVNLCSSNGCWLSSNSVVTPTEIGERGRTFIYSRFLHKKTTQSCLSSRRHLSRHPSPKLVQVEAMGPVVHLVGWQSKPLQWGYLRELKCLPRSNTDISTGLGRILIYFIYKCCRIRHPTSYGSHHKNRFILPFSLNSKIGKGAVLQSVPLLCSHRSKPLILYFYNRLHFGYRYRLLVSIYRMYSLCRTEYQEQKWIDSTAVSFSINRALLVLRS